MPPEGVGTMEEEEILRLLRQDPEAGASLLVEQYRHLLWGVCSRRLQDPEDAWDCVYEALAEFCLGWHKFRRDRGSLKSYLIAIADRKALDLYRRNQSWARARQLAAEPDRRDAHSALELRMLAAWLLEDLTERERTIVLLRCVHQMPYAEIAQNLGLSYAQTRKCGYRCLKRLRTRLSRSGDGTG